MKWSYDKQFKQWWNDGWCIYKEDDEYRLEQRFDTDLDWPLPNKTIARFKKLGAAKQVSTLIEEG